eukprot:5070_1
MGAFRWQNLHGFKTESNNEVCHLKPKFKNIKEEALNNEFKKLSKDNWNQTLRKSQIFFNSWARKRISTKYNGQYNDQITEYKEEWKRGQVVKLPDIVTLKLYTDYDKLQFALKKCFRFETFDTVAQVYDNMSDEQFKLVEENYENNRNDLIKRLRNFYHWRGQLLIVLNKFGTRLNEKNNMILYHGVNAKMILLPAQRYSFNGPLSTSSSYHVARSFSTAKGMVLKITSQFPRLNYCNAFEASLISDYPEEQEWLVGFMYVRLLEIRTRKLIDTIDQSFGGIISKIPLSSWVRQEFFTIHLFNEGIFSMSKRLERTLAQFLKANRYECCRVNEIYIDQHKEFGDWSMDHMVKRICAISHDGDDNKCHDEIKEDFGHNSKQDIQRKEKIFPLLVKKFNDFRKKPNFKQRIKFDMISDHLKRFFMERMKGYNDVNTGENKWIISFKEIITVYPNIKEIHFVNQYIFDNMLLEQLIIQISKHDNTIQKIVFLYYNYTDDPNDANNKKPFKCTTFKDPDDPEIQKKIPRGWKLKHGKNANTGYKIRLYK